MPDSTDSLAELLRLAALEPAHRPALYEALLAAEVFVIGETDLAASGRVRLDAPARLRIQNWARPDGTPVIPFFTSKRELERALEAEAGFVALPARTLFEMTRGATLVLNPRSEHGKELLPAEIESLLATGLPSQGERRVVKEATQVLLGQPAQFPTALVESLRTLLASHANVKAAYLALMHAQGENAPHLIVGIEAEGDPDAAIHAAGAVAADHCKPGEAVDFIAVARGQDGLGRALIERTAPFYVRAPGWRARLASIFGLRRS